jgi:transposase
MGRMIIGVDPHKASVTIEVVDEHGAIAARGRFPTDVRSYRTLLGYARRWPHRVWAVEGAGAAWPNDWSRTANVSCECDRRAGEAGRPGTGVRHRSGTQDRRGRCAFHRRGRPAHPGLRVLHAEDTDLQVLRLRVDRRDELSRTRIQTLNRLHRLLAELIPGGAKKDLSFQISTAGQSTPGQGPAPRPGRRRAPGAGRGTGQ